MRCSVAVTLFATGCLGSLRVSWADSYSFTLFEDSALGINNSGQIVGPAGLGSANGVFTPVVLPNIGPVGPEGINNVGQMAGFLETFDSIGPLEHGFLDTNGVFTTIDVPNSRTTQAHGLNDLGQVVGDFVDASLAEHGFLYTNGELRIIDVPGSRGTYLSGINNSGEIVGTFWDAHGDPHGFVYSNGIFTTVSVPGRGLVEAVGGINTSGQVVGTFWDALGEHGFLDTNGVFTTIELPALPGGETSAPILAGINDADQLVGSFNVCSDTSLSVLGNRRTFRSHSHHAPVSAFSPPLFPNRLRFHCSLWDYLRSPGYSDASIRREVRSNVPISAADLINQ